MIEGIAAQFRCFDENLHLRTNLRLSEEQMKKI